MREIIFRGKRLDSKEWVYGDLLRLFFNNKDSQRREIGFWSEIEGVQRVYRRVEVVPVTVGQYTGLKDKKGKKIFEGDVVKSPRGFDNTMEVIYEDIAPSDDMTAPGIGFQFNEEPEKMVVMGNIHDEPEVEIT